MAESVRRRRKYLFDYVLRRYGDGDHAPCAGCGEPLTRDTVTLDRYPIPGRLGGGYFKHNVRPMCRKCNNSHVDEPGYYEMLEVNRLNREALHQSFQDAVGQDLYKEHFSVRPDGRYRCLSCDTTCLNEFNAAVHWQTMHIKYNF